MSDTVVGDRCFSLDVGTHVIPVRPIEHLGLVAVVRPATKLDVVHRGTAARRIGHDMMELHERALARLRGCMEMAA